MMSLRHHSILLSKQPWCLFLLHFIDIDGKPLSLLCSRIVEMCFQRGLLVVHTGRESIKLAPPLSINKEALIEGVNVLESCIVDAMTEHNYNH